MATSFSGGRSREYPERTTGHGQATGKLYHLRLRFECTLFCNLQSGARTHAALVIGLYELLGNPTTQLIEPPGSCNPNLNEEGFAHICHYKFGKIISSDRH